MPLLSKVQSEMVPKISASAIVAKKSDEPQEIKKYLKMLNFEESTQLIF